MLAGIVAVANSGLVPWLFGERRRQTREREQQLSDDQRQLVEAYRKEADDVRRWRAEDAQRYEARIAELDARVGSLIEAAVLSERGNARLRHALNNIAFVIIGQHDLAIGRGEKPSISVECLRGLLGISPDLDEKLRELFGGAANPHAADFC